MSAALLAAAVAVGVPCFPCTLDKRPLTARGFKDATLDPDALADFFSRRDAALIGMPTGAASGLDALDVDPRNGGLAWEEANRHRLPETRVHETPSGGRHYLFVHAAGVRNSAGAVGAGVDVRGEGGYICVPASPGYKVISDAEPCHWPDWLLALVLKQPRPDTRPTATTNHEPIASKRIGGLVNTVLRHVGRAAEGQKHYTLRNQALYLGGLLHYGEFGKDDMARRLVEALPSGVKDADLAMKTALWGLTEGEKSPIELEDRDEFKPRLNGHEPPPPESDQDYGHVRARGPLPPDREPHQPPEEETDPAFWESLDRALGDDIPEPPPEPDAAPAPHHRKSGLIDPRDWTAPAPLREWVVQDWIPRGYATGFYGDGATGKSLVNQQLMTSIATGKPWLSMRVEIGRAFGFMCEDDEDELHRRQEHINGAMGISMADLGNLRFASRVGADNLLMTFDERSRGTPTELMGQLGRHLASFRPDLVVLDTLADIFGGDEIKRSQARLFVQGIGGNIAREFNCAVVICAHPSQSGLSTGKGTGGSTAWNNTFRSRIYLAKDEANDNLRTLQRMKANYAATEGKLILRWRNGVFVPMRDEPTEIKGLAWSQMLLLFNAVEKAWEEERPYSIAPQTKKDGRYLPLWAETTHGMHPLSVIRGVEAWLATGYMGSVVFDQRTKAKGLKVLKRLTKMTSQEMDEAAEDA